MAKRNLHGAVALVTGASSGVGWQAALRLGQQGMRLCVTARRREPLEALCRELRAQGTECLAIAGDVAVADDVDRIVGGCIRHFGGVDLLVNNAGVQVYACFEDYDWEEIERLFDVNCFGYLRFARAVLPHFRARGRGSIVNVLSVMAEGQLQFFSIYAATKHALLGWANSLRLELDGSGIDVSSVLLPAIATPLYDHARSKTGTRMKPLPPIYDTDVAARAVVACARKPQRTLAPVFLQGTLILWSDKLLPGIGDFILRRIGVKGQMRDGYADPNGGNLFQPSLTVEPSLTGAGPRGTLQPTPGWQRYAPAVGAAMVVGYAASRALKRAATPS